MQSGCGKTSVTLALLQSLKNQGIAVAPYKAGPDFLDPLWHQAITGRPSSNLDTYMVGVEESARLLGKGETRDLVLVEGVMGLFDGRQGVGERGSSLDLASKLQLEVWLVVDAKGMSGSIVPLVSGFADFAAQRGVEISAVIANRVGSSRHAELLTAFLDDHDLPPLVGWLEKGAPQLPERHLGLVRPQEQTIPDLSAFYHWQTKPELVSAMAENGELDQGDYQFHSEDSGDRPNGRLEGKKIGVARDGACCFLYPENIQWLENQGAEVHFFSPLAGDELPQGVDALWLPGGYPELYAEVLSSSPTLRSIHRFVDSGGAVLAECGGMMLLGRELVDHAGEHWPMAGLFPFATVMQQRLAGLGYREEQDGARGHEFHHSTREGDDSSQKAFSLMRGDEGVRLKNLRASYIHWYFPSAPEQVAGWFQP